MVGGVVARKPTKEVRSKVKTGCATCSNRIRKVKCDEDKPFCRKCVNTGRTCDGYGSPFRLYKGQSTRTVHTGGIKSASELLPIRATLLDITWQKIDILNYYFSTKTMFDVRLDCDDEAKQVLQAGLSNPPLRHAVLSLKALRDDLETFGDGPASVAPQTPSHLYGLQQYGIALGGLASNLSSPNSHRLHSALLCCQIFISIEQVRKNYTAMAQHIIRGLRIMREYRARPCLVAPDSLMLAHRAQLPFLDVFIIKLFVAPCKFAEPPAEIDVNSVLREPPVLFHDLRTIAPNKRTQLTKIAALIVDFLDRVSRVATVESARQLLLERSVLLESLKSWKIDLDFGQSMIGLSASEPISMSFLRIFHLILKIILLGTLDSSPDLDNKLHIESSRLQCVANIVGDRVKTYITCYGTSNGRSESYMKRTS